MLKVTMPNGLTVEGESNEIKHLLMGMLSGPIGKRNPKKKTGSRRFKKHTRSEKRYSRACMKWTADEDNFLRHPGDLSIHEQAKTLGRTKKAVGIRRVRLNLPAA